MEKLQTIINAGFHRYLREKKKKTCDMGQGKGANCDITELILFDFTDLITESVDTRNVVSFAAAFRDVKKRLRRRLIET